MSSSDLKEAQLLALMDRTGYNIIQENGQRKFGPPPNWHGPPPPKGCEVFVGKIPRDLYEDELVPVFEKIGMIYEVRLMMDFSGSNRGYAFVMYTSGLDAKRAVKELDNFEIRRNRFIGVCKSVDNCRLFVGGIPKSKTKDEILREMRRITDDVSDVILYSSFQDKTKNRGFAFVEYENHRAAAMARRKLIPGRILLWGQEIAVDWAEPEPEVDENTMSKVTILYVRNLTTATTEEDLMRIFSLNDTVQVDKVKKLRDFAFIHYAIREDAETALFQLNNAAIDNSVIEVTWAKPVDRANRRRSRLADQSNKELNSNIPSLNGQLPSVESLASSFSNMMNPVGLNPGLVQKSSSLRYLRSPTSISPCARNRNFPTLISSIGSEHSPRYRGPSNPIQMLQDICHKNLWGDPTFLMYTFSNNSEDQKLYFCKVFIPALCKQENQYFSTDKLCQLPEEAKLIVAEHTLKELGLCLNVNGPQTFVSSPSVSLDQGQGDMGNIFFSQSCTGNPSGLALSHASFMKPHLDSSKLFDVQ